MSDENDRHAACVAAWFGRTAKGLPSARLVDLLERACEALWARVRSTLGDVTMGAIVDRVVHEAAGQFAPFGALEVGPAGVGFAGLRARAEGLSEGELGGGVRLLLADLLRVLGHLTAEVLTPALHATLTAVTSGPDAPPGESARGGVEPARRRAKKRGKP